MAPVNCVAKDANAAQRTVKTKSAWRLQNGAGAVELPDFTAEENRPRILAEGMQTKEGSFPSPFAPPQKLYVARKVEAYVEEA